MDPNVVYFAIGGLFVIFMDILFSIETFILTKVTYYRKLKKSLDNEGEKRGK